MDHEISCIDERSIDFQNQGHIWAILQLTVGSRNLPMSMMGVAKCQLCEVVCYCAGSNGTEISIRYTEQRVSAAEEF